MAGRPNEQIEQRLVAEWLQANRSGYWFQTRVRLGALASELAGDDLTEAERRMLHGAWARWADAIVELPDRTELIEGKIIAHPVAIGQLELYARLLPETTDLAHRRTLPVEKIMLYAIPDAHVCAMAVERGIRCVEFRPPWVYEALARRLPRHQRAPLAQSATDALGGARS